MTTCRADGPDVLLGSRPMRAVADRLRLLAAQPFQPVFITGPAGLLLMRHDRGEPYLACPAVEIGTAIVDFPPLAEHRDDIPLLARAFVETFSAEQGTRRILSRAALAKLMEYRLPGNVRELRNIIRRAVIVAGTVEIAAADIVLPT